MRRGLLAVAAVVAAALVAVATVAVLRFDYVALRVGTVREGVLYRSSALDAAALDALVREKGIRTIVDLQKPEEARYPDADRDVAFARGARYVPLPSTQVPPDEVVERFLAIMRDPANHPVLLHCEHGVGRTGVLSAVYRLEFEGASLARVLDEARSYAFGLSFEPGTAKCRFLEAYAARPR